MVAYELSSFNPKISRTQLMTPFDEPRYLHYMEVVSSFHLFQTVYTSDSGNVTTALIGEELLLWLNMHYIAPSSEEGPVLDAQEKPWLDVDFWTFLIRYDNHFFSMFRLCCVRLNAPTWLAAYYAGYQNLLSTFSTN